MLKSFLRWAGGKTKLVSYLKLNLPDDFHNRVYIEPFLGAGSLYFATNPQIAYLSDLNENLINCYLQIKVNVLELYSLLEQILSQHSKENYYEIRNKFNNGSIPVEKAAQFIYLNKSSFNGIYRVNNKNQYNVPFGYIKKPAIPTLNQLIKVSEMLKNSDISTRNYLETECYTSDKSFYYLDPPYPPINNTSFFTHYTKERFGEKDQKTVRDFAIRVANKGAKVLISNADLPFIHELYNNWKIIKTSTTRWVSSKKKRYKINELLIKNY